MHIRSFISISAVVLGLSVAPALAQSPVGSGATVPSNPSSSGVTDRGGLRTTEPPWTTSGSHQPTGSVDVPLPTRSDGDRSGGNATTGTTGSTSTSTSGTGTTSQPARANQPDSRSTPTPSNQAAPSSPDTSGTSGQLPDRLPDTASNLPSLVVLAFTSLLGAVGLRAARTRV